MRSRSRLPLLTAIAGLTLASAAGLSTVRAEPFAGDVPDRVWIDLGGSYNDVSTNVALQGPRGIGVIVNFEDVFDVPGSKTTLRLVGTVRITDKRSRIDFGYVNINRSGSRVLQYDVEFGDYTFQAGAEATARFQTQFSYAAYRYDFLHEEKIRVSGSAGLTFINMKTRVAGTASFDDPTNPGTTITGYVEKEGSQGAPVPMVGLNLDWALTKRLITRLYSRFFRLNLSSFNGGLNENGLRLNWYFVKNFGLGLGYDQQTLRIKDLKVGDNDHLKAGYSITGFALYANMAF